MQELTLIAKELDSHHAQLLARCPGCLKWLMMKEPLRTDWLRPGIARSDRTHTSLLGKVRRWKCLRCGAAPFADVQNLFVRRRGEFRREPLTKTA